MAECWWIHEILSYPLCTQTGKENWKFIIYFSTLSIWTSIMEMKCCDGLISIVWTHQTIVTKKVTTYRRKLIGLNHLFRFVALEIFLRSICLKSRMHYKKCKWKLLLLISKPIYWPWNYVKNIWFHSVVKSIEFI